MRLNYLLIPLVTVAVAVGGSMLTSGGMDWYRSINIPSWTPPGSVIGTVWTVIFILTATAAILVWNSKVSREKLQIIALVLILNGALNMLWSYLFFTQHLMGIAAIEAALLDLTVIALIALIWPISRLAAGLLVPYAAWVAFATYLTTIVWSLN